MTTASAETASSSARLQGPIAKLARLKTQCTGAVFDKHVFAEVGLFVVTGAFRPSTIEPWLRAWSAFAQSSLSARRVNAFNPVALNEEPPDELKAICRNKTLLDIAEQIFGPNIALYNFRLVVKDQYSRGPVFRHQDIPYHTGHMNRASFFVPLSKANRQNGGMTYFPGTHKFGYLGDAGELLDDILPGEWPSLTPDLVPGDLAIMDSALWHESGSFIEGEDRVLVDIHLQPASDPSSEEVLRGEFCGEYRIPPALRGKVFKRSRVTRLVELQAEVDRLKSECRPKPAAAERS
ncbi:MAG TPA: phytanoyl-CoA dioxygenase family protein [Planctomycetaceae bacterium]|nr:phytanoyl-CoA dioxygenase family protein [Planctomycetaceae bacterium]